MTDRLLKTKHRPQLLCTVWITIKDWIIIEDTKVTVENWSFHNSGLMLTRKSQIPVFCPVVSSCFQYWFCNNFFFLPSTGLVKFRNSQAEDQIISRHLAPLRYLDDQGQPTEEYPLNPNGSPQGIAGLCSRDGRHLAMMPHPERCTLGWQWAWAPRDLRSSLMPSPWLRMFRNAAAWCSKAQWQHPYQQEFVLWPGLGWIWTDFIITIQLFTSWCSWLVTR